MDKIAIRSPEAARLMSISERKLWQLAKTGGLPYVKTAGTKLFVVADIVEWLKQNAKGGSDGIPCECPK